jgi:hypothetical protein
MATSFTASWSTVETLGLVLQRPLTATHRPGCIMLLCYIYCHTIGTAQCGDWHMLPLWTFSCCGTSEKVPGKLSSYIYWPFSCYAQYIRPIYDTVLLPWLTLDTTSANHILPLWTFVAGKLPGKFQESAEIMYWAISAAPSILYDMYIPEYYYYWCLMSHHPYMDAATLDSTRTLPESSRKVPIIGVGWY